MTPYGVGPIYMQTEDEAKRAFDYAAALGVPVVVGVPWKPAADGGKGWKQRRQSPELCAKVSDLCAKYDIKFASTTTDATRRRARRPSLARRPTCGMW